MATFVNLGFNPIGANAQSTAGSSVGAGTSVTLTAPTDASKLLMQAFVQSCKFTLDESAPGTFSTGNGFELTAGDPPMLIPIKAGQDIKIVQEAAGAVVNYQFGN